MERNPSEGRKTPAEDSSAEHIDRLRRLHQIQGPGPLGRGQLRSDAIDPVAAYAFDLLVALRGMLAGPQHPFLSYLIGMAAEESFRLAEGHPSAAASGRTGSRKSKPRRLGGKA